MAITDKVSRIIKCEGPDCKNEVTFDPQNIEQIKALPDWIRTYRTIQNGQRASFGYCSDVCEVKGVTTGKHNVPEPKAVAEATTEADIRQAAHEAKQAAEATDALKNGTIQLTDRD